MEPVELPVESLSPEEAAAGLELGEAPAPPEGGAEAAEKALDDELEAPEPTRDDAAAVAKELVALVESIVHAAGATGSGEPPPPGQLSDGERAALKALAPSAAPYCAKWIGASGMVGAVAFAAIAVLAVRRQLAARRASKKTEPESPAPVVQQGAQNGSRAPGFPPPFVPGQASR